MYKCVIQMTGKKTETLMNRLITLESLDVAVAQ